MVNSQQKKKGGQILFDKKVYVRLAIDVYTALEDLLVRTQFQTMGELFRHILDKKTVTAQYYDAISDMLLEEIETLGVELEVKDRCIHGMARRVYTLSGDPTELLVNARAAVEHYQEVGELIPALYELVKKVAGRWITV